MEFTASNFDVARKFFNIVRNPNPPYPGPHRGVRGVTAARRRDGTSEQREGAAMLESDGTDRAGFPEQLPALEQRPP